MADKLTGLQQNWKARGTDAREKALAAIEQMTRTGQKVNFSSVSKTSGISKSFLYETEEIRKRIEEQRRCEVDSEIFFYRQHVDLIVTDIMMPGMDGYELVRCLREYRQNVPVIFLTAKSSFDDKRKGVASGIDDYTTKSVNYEVLLWRIQALLRCPNINASQRIVIDPITIDSASYIVSRGAERIELPKRNLNCFSNSFLIPI